MLGHFSSSQISELTCQGFVVTPLTGQDATPLCIACKNVLHASGTGKSKDKTSNVVLVSIIVRNVKLKILLCAGRA